MTPPGYVEGPTTLPAAYFIDDETPLLVTSAPEELAIHKVELKSSTVQLLHTIRSDRPLGEGTPQIGGSPTAGLLTIAMASKPEAVLGSESSKGNYQVQNALVDLKTGESIWVGDAAAGPACIDENGSRICWFSHTRSEAMGIVMFTFAEIRRNPLAIGELQTRKLYGIAALPSAVLAAGKDQIIFTTTRATFPLTMKDEKDAAVAYTIYSYDEKSETLTDLGEQKTPSFSGFTAAVSPDGEHLAYLKTDGESDGARIVVKDMNGLNIAEHELHTVSAGLFGLLPAWIDDQTLCIPVASDKPDRAFEMALIQFDKPGQQSVWTSDWRDAEQLQFLNVRSVRNNPSQIKLSK